MSAARHDVQYAQRSKNPVAGSRFAIAKDNVTRLLSSQSRASLLHLFQHILVAYVRSKHADARIPQRNLSPHVGHRSRDHCVSREDAAVFHIPSRHQENCVAVYYPAFSITEQCAIRVAVESYPEIEFSRLRRYCLCCI